MKMIKISPLMFELRSTLDANHISWHDDSEIWWDAIVERTKIPALTKDGDITSVVYIYPTLPGSKMGFSYGYPDFLEVWNHDWTDEPEPMSVNDILQRLMSNGD